MKLLDDQFYARETIIVAKELLGKVMTCQTFQGESSGIVVETEAYLGTNDPASHSFRGKTKRNEAMFGSPGRSYIYQIYGIHFCYNVTTDKNEIPAAVLIRALQPLTGLDLMKTNRKNDNIQNLCSGPAKLVQAMGIPKNFNGTSVVDGPIRFYEHDILGEFNIKETTRIGITLGKESLLRFYVQGNKYISKK